MNAVVLAVMSLAAMVVVALGGMTGGYGYTSGSRLSIGGGGGSMGIFGMLIFRKLHITIYIIWISKTG